MKTKILGYFQFLGKYFLSGFIFALGIIAAVLGVSAFQNMTTSPGTAGNQSLSAPMLSKSGSIFNRNYHSLEAIANALGLPSEGTGKRIFVTRQRWQGNLGGLAGADAKCQAAATAQSLGGTWKAVLSSSTADAVSRMSPAQTIFNLKGEIIVYNPLSKGLFEQWKAKTNSSQYEIRWPLITDEFGIYYPTGVNGPWTNSTINANEVIHFWGFTNRDGTKVSTNSSSSCLDWTNSSSSYNQSTTFNGILNLSSSFDGSNFFQANITSASSQCPYSAGAGAANCQYCDNLRSLLCQEQ